MSDQDQLVKRLATSFCGHAQCLKERGDAATAIQKQAATIAAHEATIKELRAALEKIRDREWNNYGDEQPANIARKALAGGDA